MSEVTFAKSFLSSLDKKPIKLAADHVSDPRKYPNQSPFTLPRQTHPYPRKSAPSTPASQAQNNVTATLKPMRSGAATTIPNLSLDSSIHDIKTLYAQQTSTPQDKIKLLLNKKPAADLKTLRELGVSGDAVEFSVMVMGGGSSTPSTSTPVAEKADPAESVPTPATAPTPAPAVSQVDKMTVDQDSSLPGSEKAQAEAEKTPASAPKAASSGAGPSGPGALNTGEFWDDLQDFLTQRLRDGEEAEKLIKIFKIGWINSKED